MIDYGKILDAINKAEKEIPERDRLIRIIYDGNKYCTRNTSRQIEVRRMSQGLHDFLAGIYKNPQEARIRVIRNMLLEGIVQNANAYEIMNFGVNETDDKPKEYVGVVEVLYYKILNQK